MKDQRILQNDMQFYQTITYNDERENENHRDKITKEKNKNTIFLIEGLSREWLEFLASMDQHSATKN